MPTGENHSNFVKFLGTAGSRWVVARQTRASGGVYLELEGSKALLDPGPGALVRCAEADPPIDPVELDALILSHRHIDHCNDVNIMMDAMTGGGLRRRGRLFAPRNCLEGSEPVVLQYVRGFVDGITILEPGMQYRIGNLHFATTVDLEHGGDAFGLHFALPNGRLSFLTDTRAFPDLGALFAGSDTLVINVTLLRRPDSPRILHLCMDDVREIALQARPRRLILTHFGVHVLQEGPENIARDLQDRLGIEVLAATDGMRLEV